jgi:hypothetical protein
MLLPINPSKQKRSETPTFGGAFYPKTVNLTSTLKSRHHFIMPTLNWNEIRLRAARFSGEWAGATSERGEA